MWFEWLLAYRLLLEGRAQSLLIISGIGVGVCVIVFLTALIGGLQKQIIDRTLGTQAHIRVRPPEELARPLRTEAEAEAGLISQVDQRAQRLRALDQWQRIEQSLLAADDITAVSPLASGPALARRGAASRSVVILGIEPERYTRIVPVQDSLQEGRFAIVGNDIAIGRQLATELGARLGDRLRLDAGDGRADVFTIVGIFELGVRDIDQRFVYTALKPAQSLLDLPGGVSSLDLRVTEIFQAEPIAQRISARLGVNAESWMTLNRNVLDALSAQSMSTNLIKFFVGLSAAFGIASVLAVSVVQRGREIGILRAMGTGRSQVLRVFLIQGGVVGLLGSALGALGGAGLIGAWSAAGLSRSGRGSFELAVSPELFIGATLLATVVGMLAAVAPARRAAKLDPVEAMRGG
ncbi:MAG: ABC transporter permease [Xanthomonadales bacterium]|nr:ABC transporter permease [Xanthomonadales bacterium]